MFLFIVLLAETVFADWVTEDLVDSCNICYGEEKAEISIDMKSTCIRETSSQNFASLVKFKKPRIFILKNLLKDIQTESLITISGKEFKVVVSAEHSFKVHDLC